MLHILNLITVKTQPLNLKIATVPGYWPKEFHETKSRTPYEQRNSLIKQEQLCQSHGTRLLVSVKNLMTPKVESAMLSRLVS